MRKILFIFGTRPEAIKMAPLIKIFNSDKENFITKVCVTAQHRLMLDQVLNFFEIVPDFDLDLMKSDQTLFDITSYGIKGLEKVLNECNPDYIFVQGDTTTAFIGALAGYYKKIKIIHIEAGLRSGNKYSPYPEEINRILTGHLSDIHFAPTERAKNNLLSEGIKDNIYVVGNSVIDALFLTLGIIKREGEEKYCKQFEFLDMSKKIILVTSHRRESFGKPFEEICEALKELSQSIDVEIIYPVHLNPNVREPVNRILTNIKNIYLIEPLEYPSLVWLINKSYIVLTDSGGIQEESPSLGKPVIVMREVTERTEGIEAGNAKLVGTDKTTILKEINLLLKDKEEYDKMKNVKNPYGDGRTSQRILDIIRDFKD